MKGTIGRTNYTKLCIFFIDTYLLSGAKNNFFYNLKFDCCAYKNKFCASLTK